MTNLYDKFLLANAAGVHQLNSRSNGIASGNID